MATDGQSSLKLSPHQSAGTLDDFARPTVFQRMRELRKRGQSLTPAPITVVEEQPVGDERRIPTYENVFAFSRRTGLSPALIDRFIDAGLISCLRIEHDGMYVNVRKALAEIEALENKRTAV